MKKRKVIHFFIVFLIFVCLLMLLQIIRYGSLTGYLVSYTGDNYGLSDAGLKVRILGYKAESSILSVSYSVESGKVTKEVFVISTLAPEDESWLVQGRQTVFVPSGREGNYIVEMEIPASTAKNLELTIEAYDEENSAVTKKFLSLSNNLITGYAISASDKSRAFEIASILSIVIIIFLAITLLHKHHNKAHKHQMRHKGRFITLDLNEESKQ